MTLGVIARIHWQALQLWLKRVRFSSQARGPAHRDPFPRPVRTHPRDPP
jgi:DUF1365 family protein